MTDSFVHLHAHSTYSRLDGYGTPEQIRDRILELGQPAVAVTDHGSVIAHVPYSMAFKGTGIKTIFGIEAYIVDDMTSKTKIQESLGSSAIPHITILAKNATGYRNLLALNNQAYERGFFYYPRIDHELLFRHQEGLIVLSGCPGGYLTRIITANLTEETRHPEPIIAENLERARDHIKRLRNNIEHFYLEFVPQPDYWQSFVAFCPTMQLGGELQIPVVMTADAHFPRPEDWDAQDTLLSVGLRKQRNDPTRGLKLPKYQYYCSRDELHKRARALTTWDNRDELINRALDNSVAIASLVDVELPRGKMVSFPDVPENSSSDKLLWERASAGLTKRYLDGLITPQQLFEYQTRLSQEFLTIQRKGFCDYILAIADVVAWSIKQQGLVILRGSAGGSLLLWALGASDTDPIRYELSFERFYDDNRPDPPDVDVDFEHRIRGEAIEYVFEKYGRENCSQIAALSTLKAKAALVDAAFALGIPRTEFKSLSDALDSKDEDTDAQIAYIQDPDAIAVLEKHPELKIFQRLIGQCRQTSVHAAGVLVSSRPLGEVIGLIVDQDKKVVAAVDKYGAQELGLLKMDFLSVNTLDVVAKAAMSAKGNIDWLYNMAMDDPAVFQTAANGHLRGVFQLDGHSARRVLAEIGATEFEDLVAASVLCRPGASEFVGQYKKYKADPELFKAFLSQFHPLAQQIVSHTYGILMYQEQVMAMARELAGFDWPSVHKLRKGVTSSAGAEWFNDWKAKFVQGCVGNGVSVSEAEYWWGAIVYHGSYSFNRSHAVSYAKVSYWTLYLKTYYPSEFYVAALTLEADPINQKALVYEFISRGGQVSLLDYRYPNPGFTAVTNDWLVGGLCGIKGVGDKTAEKVKAKGPFKNYLELLDALPKAAANGLKACWDGNQLDPVMTIRVAPWFPIKTIAAEDDRWRREVYCQSCGDVARSASGQVFMCGYASLVNIDKFKCTVQLEDDFGSIVARTSARKFAEVVPLVKNVKAGDFVAVSGWWSGETLFIDGIDVVRTVNQT